MSDLASAQSGLQVAARRQLAALRSGTERVRSRTRPYWTLNAWQNTWFGKVRILLVALDAALIGLTLVITYVLRFGTDRGAPVDGTANVTHELVGLGVGLIWMVFLGARETRSAPVIGAGLEEYRRVLQASFYTFGLVAIISYLVEADVSRSFFAIALPLGTLMLLGGRLAARASLNRARLAGRAMTPTLIVGDVDEIRDICTHLRRNPAAGYQPHAVCLAGSDRVHRFSGLPVVRTSDLMDYVSTNRLGAVVVGGGLSRSHIRRLAWHLENSSTQLLFVPRLTDVAGPRLTIRAAQGLDLLHVELPRYAGGRYWLKRSFDIVFAAVALALLAPVLGVIALAIKLDSEGPVLFRQNRVGVAGQFFRIDKFRTMHVDAEARLAGLQSRSIGHGPLFKMEDDPRVTKVGRILRRYSLDELPQFWTVLRGDMSIVGPRPHLAHELAAFPDDGMRRLLIKPGITGLWQVSGRSDLPLEDAIRLDLSYVENWTLTGDLAIILRTVKAVLRPSGAY